MLEEGALDGGMVWGLMLTGAACSTGVLVAAVLIVVAS